MERTQELPRVMSFQEYLDFSEFADERYEFHAFSDGSGRGEVLAMSQTTEPHAVISFNLAAALHTALRGSNCRGMSNEMRIYAPAGNRKRSGGSKHLFPDASVRCGDPEFAGPEQGEPEGKRNTLLNPVALFEILSPSTAAYDLGEKFVAYSAIPSFREYVILHQDQRMVETRVRRPDGTWALRVNVAPPLGDDGEVHLESLSIHLSMDDLYEGVEPEADAAAG